MGRSKLQTVQSQYINPDKFIEKLKREISIQKRRVEYKDKFIAEINAKSDELRKNAYGKFWFDFSDPGHELSVNLTGNYVAKELENMKIDTNVVCFGKIVGYSCSKNGKNTVDMTIKSVYLKRAE